MSNSARRPEPGLPDFVGAVVVFELLLVFLRLGLAWWTWTGIEQIGLTRGSAFTVACIVFVSSVLALGSLIGAVGILTHQRTAPVFLRWLVVPCSLIVVVSLMVAMHASATGVGLGGLVLLNVMLLIPLLSWVLGLREAAEQAERMFRVVDYPLALTSKDLTYLRGYTNLRELSLANLPLTPLDFDQLQGLVDLERLNLSGTPATNGDIAKLLRLRRLEYLNLKGTKVTREVREILSPLPVLREVVLDGEIVAPVQRPLAGLQPGSPQPPAKNPTMPFGGFPPGYRPESAPAQPAPAPAPREIVVAEQADARPAGPEVISIAPKKRTKEIRSWPTSEENDPGLPDLVRVALVVDALFCMLRIAQMAVWHAMAQGGDAGDAYVAIGALAVQGSIVGLSVGGCLAVLNHRRYGIGVYYCAFAAIGLFQAAQGLGTLAAQLPKPEKLAALLAFGVTTVLVVGWNSFVVFVLSRASKMFAFSDAPRTLLRSDFPHLSSYHDVRWLSLAANPNLCDDDCAILGGLPRLEQLDLSRTAVSDDGVRRLEALATLKRLNLDGTKVTEAVLASLSRMQALEEVSLTATKCPPEALEAYERTRWNWNPPREAPPEPQPAAVDLERLEDTDPAATKVERQDQAFDAFLATLPPGKQDS